jgi:uncharacterized protein with FMN-binding domain
MRTSTIKSLAALALTGAGTALVFGFQTTDGVVLDPGNGASTSTTGSTGSTGSKGSTSTGSTGSTGSSGSTGSTGSSSRGSGYADGTWTGAAVREPWGAFQVQVVISNGSIVDVNVTESPSDRNSSRINSRAVPILTESALAAQSAQIDFVSGATWTSNSYTESLQSALDEAAAA